MDDGALFSSSDSEGVEVLESDDESEFEDSLDLTASSPDPDVWTDDFVPLERDRQIRWKAAILYALHTQATHLHANLVRLILTFAPPQFCGVRPLPQATSSIFKVHIHGSIGVILTTACELYLLHLPSGRFWWDGATPHLYVLKGRVKSATFHPTQPLLLIYRWHSAHCDLFQYPDSFAPPMHQIHQWPQTEIAPPTANGVSFCPQGFLNWDMQGHLTVYTFQNIQALHLNGRTLAVEGPTTFTKIHSYCPSTDHVQLWRQTRHPHNQWPMQLAKWDPARNEEVSTQWYNGLNCAILDVVESSTRLIGITATKSIVLWEHTGPFIQIMRRHYYPITAVACIPGRPFILTTSFDKSIRLWDVLAGVECKTEAAQQYWNTGSRKPQSIAVSGATRVLVGYDTKDIHVYDL